MEYQALQGNDWRHIWLVGDLHGCRSQLDAALCSSDFNANLDLVISVGDIIDRGPDSPGCLALLAEPWFRAVRGNHEEMALEALTQGEHHQWQMNGGEWYYALRGMARLSARHALLGCATLPLIIQVQLSDRVVIVAHADYPTERYRWQQPVDKTSVLWSRERLYQLQQGCGSPIAGADAFYFGHTPLDTPYQRFNLHYIDTGAVFGNPLTLVQIQ
ncbi:serine/threonine-protein phosphatase [Enterobacterales bacterium CwR94]|nr:serine/threonine-protein phosphatase [Enterobacterales bacterium CwR94]